MSDEAVVFGDSVQAGIVNEEGGKKQKVSTVFKQNIV